MSCYLLDTDISSYLIRGDHPEVTNMFVQHFADCCISVITYAELKYGTMRRASPKLTHKVNAFCKLVRCIEWDIQAAEEYAEIRTNLEKDGVTIGSMDMLIAAAALAADATLVTNNTKHFSRIRKLKTVNWLAH